MGDDGSIDYTGAPKVSGKPLEKLKQLDLPGLSLTMLYIHKRYSWLRVGI